MKPIDLIPNITVLIIVLVFIALMPTIVFLFLVKVVYLAFFDNSYWDFIKEHYRFFLIISPLLIVFGALAVLEFLDILDLI